MNQDLACSEFAIGNDKGTMSFLTSTNTAAFTNEVHISLSDYVPIKHSIVHSYILQVHNNALPCTFTDPWGANHLFMNNDLHSTRTIYVMDSSFNADASFSISTNEEDADSSIDVKMHLTINYFHISNQVSQLSDECVNETSLEVHPVNGHGVINEFRWDAYDFIVSRVEQKFEVPSGVYNGASLVFGSSDAEILLKLPQTGDVLCNATQSGNVFSFKLALSDTSACSISLVGDNHLLEVKCKLYLYYSTTSLNYSTFSSRYFRNPFTPADVHVHLNVHNTLNERILKPIHCKFNTIEPIRCSESQTIYCDYVTDVSSMTLNNTYVYGCICYADAFIKVGADAEIQNDGLPFIKAINSANTISLRSADDKNMRRMLFLSQIS